MTNLIKKSNGCDFESWINVVKKLLKDVYKYTSHALHTLDKSAWQVYYEYNYTPTAATAEEHFG